MFTQKELLVAPQYSSHVNCSVLWNMGADGKIERASPTETVMTMDYIGVEDMYSMFDGWLHFDKVYFPNLVHIGARGLYGAFLSGFYATDPEVFFPELRFIGVDGLNECFANYDGYAPPTVHFRADLSDEAKVEAQKCGSYNILYDL